MKKTIIIPQSGEINSGDLEKAKLLELIHIASNILSGGFLGVVAVGIFLLFTQPSPHIKKISYEIINFNLSFIIWFALGFISLFILIGFIILPVLYVAWFIFMVLGAMKHFTGDTYEYPMSITFLK